MWSCASHVIAPALLPGRPRNQLPAQHPAAPRLADCWWLLAALWMWIQMGVATLHWRPGFTACSLAVKKGAGGL